MLPLTISRAVYAGIVTFLSALLVTQNPKAVTWVWTTISPPPAPPVVDIPEPTEPTVSHPSSKPSRSVVTVSEVNDLYCPEESPLQTSNVAPTPHTLTTSYVTTTSYVATTSHVPTASHIPAISHGPNSSYSLLLILIGMGLACLLIAIAYFLKKTLYSNKPKPQQTEKEIAQSLEDLAGLRLTLEDRQQPAEANDVSVESIMVDMKTSNEEQYVKEGHAMLYEQDTCEEEMGKALAATVVELSNLQDKFSQVNDANISLGRELDDERKAHQELMEEMNQISELARKKDNEVIELKTKSNQQEKDLVQVQEIIQSLNKQTGRDAGLKTQFGQQKQELTETVRSLGRKLANAEKSSEQSKQEKQAFSRGAEDAEKTVAELKDKVNLREQFISREKKASQSLRHELASKEESWLALEKENEALSKRSEKQQETLADLNRKFQQLDQEAVAKEDLNQSLQQQLADKEESCLAFEKENEALSQDAKQYEKTTAALTEDVNGLEQSLRDHVADQKKARSAFLDEKEALRYEIRQQNEMIIELTEEADFRIGRLSTLQEANEDLQETKIDLERQAGIDEEWGKNLEEMLADAESYRELFAAERDSTIEKLSNETAYLTRELKTAREVIADVTKDRDACKMVSESTLRESNALRQLAEDLRHSLGAVQSENEQLQGGVQYVQDTRAAYGDLMARLNVVNCQKDHLGTRLTRSRQDMKEMQAKFEETHRERNELQAQNAALRRSHEEDVARIKASFAVAKKRIADASARKAFVMANPAIPASANLENFTEHRHTSTISAASSEDAEPCTFLSRPVPASLPGGSESFAQTTSFGQQLTSTLDMSSSTQAVPISPSAAPSSPTVSSSSKTSSQTSRSSSAATSIAEAALSETRVQRLHPSRSPVVQEVPAKAYVLVTVTDQPRMDSVARKRRTLTMFRKFEAGSVIFVADHEKSELSSLKDQQHIRNRRRSIAGCESQVEMDMFTCFFGPGTIAPSPTANPAKFSEPYYLERLFGTTGNSLGKVIPRQVFETATEAFKIASKADQVAMHAYTMHGGSRGLDLGPPSPISVDVDTSSSLKRESIYRPNQFTTEPFWHPFEARTKLQPEGALQSAGGSPCDNQGLVQGDVQDEIDSIAVSGTALKDAHRQLVLGRNPSWKPPTGATYVLKKHNVAQLLRLAGREDLVAKFTVNFQNVSTLQSTPLQQTPNPPASIIFSKNAAQSSSSDVSTVAKVSEPLSAAAAPFIPLKQVALPTAEPPPPAVPPTAEPLTPAALPTTEPVSKSDKKPTWKKAIQYQQLFIEVSTPSATPDPTPVPAVNPSNTASTSVMESKWSTAPDLSTISATPDPPPAPAINPSNTALARSKWSTAPDLPSPTSAVFPTKVVPTANQSNLASTSVAKSKWSTAPDLPSPTAAVFPTKVAPTANQSNLASMSVAKSKWSTAPDLLSPAAATFPTTAADPSNHAAEASTTRTAKKRGPYASTPGYEMEPSMHANDPVEVNNKKSSNYRQQKNHTGGRSNPGNSNCSAQQSNHTGGGFNSRNSKKSRNQW